MIFFSPSDTMLLVLAVLFCFFSVVQGAVEQRSIAASDNSTSPHALSKRACSNLAGDEAASVAAAFGSPVCGGILVCQIVAADGLCHVTSVTDNL